VLILLKSKREFADATPTCACQGPDGNFYASELFTNLDVINGGDPENDVVKVPFNSPSTQTFLTGGVLSFTGGLAVGPNNVVYVADGTFFVPEGKVGRLSQ
jgi:hypothetical protein